MSLLCQLRGQLKANGALSTTIVAPALRLNVVPIRTAAALTKGQKATLAKYGNRANKPGRKSDFLSNAKNTLQGKTGKKQGKEVAAEPGKTKISIFTNSTTTKEHQKTEKELEAESDGMFAVPELNMEYNLPSFNVTSERYEEYEALQRPNDLEEVTENQLANERAEYIKRLWEPYETETFNLKSLIGNSPSSEEIVREQNRDDKPSKMLFYSDEDLEKYLPEGLSGKINKTLEWPGVTTKAVMVRPMVESIISWMEGWKQRQFIGRTKDEDFYSLLSGPLGCGKSALLNPIVHYARASGWLVLFVPDGKDWAGFPRKKSGFEKMLSYSKINDTWFGQPYLATKWITALLKAHGDKLSQIHLRTEFTVRDVDPDKPSFLSLPEHTLKTLLDYALKYPQQASDCIYYLRQELCTVTEFPVLIVVDAVNTLQGFSRYGDPIDPYIFAPYLDTSRLVLTRAFQDYRHHGLINGLYVGALSNSANLKPIQEKRPNPDKLRTQYDFPSNLNLVKVPPLSRIEAHLLADWYRDNGIFAEEVPAQTVDYMWAMSQGNGDMFWKQAESI